VERALVIDFRNLVNKYIGEFRGVLQASSRTAGRCFHQIGAGTLGAVTCPCRLRF
jgi:hypothetical protein